MGNKPMIKSAEEDSDDSFKDILNQCVDRYGWGRLDITKLLGKLSSLSAFEPSQLRQAMADYAIKGIYISDSHYHDRNTFPGWSTLRKVIGALQGVERLVMQDVSPTTQSQAAVILRCSNSLTTINVQHWEGQPVLKDDFLQALEERPHALETVIVEWMHPQYPPPSQCERFCRALSTFPNATVSGDQINFGAFDHWPGFFEKLFLSATTKTLRLEGTRLPQSLVDVLRLPSCTLEDLQLIRVDAANEGRIAELFHAIEASSSLRSFTFDPCYDCSGGPESFAAFRRILARNTILESLKINRTWTKSGQRFDMQQKEGWHENSSLVELNLKGNSAVGNELGRIVADKLRHPGSKLRSVNLSGCGIEADTLRETAAALESDALSLEAIDIRGNDIGDAEMTALCGALKKNTHLKICHLGRVPLNDEAIEAITGFLKANTILQTFSIQKSGEPKISEEAFGCLIDGLRENCIINDLDLGTEDPLQECICLYTTLNARVDRASLMSQDATRELMFDALGAVKENLDHIFLLLRQNPFICLR